MPCVVPKEWISPPDHDTADGELLDDEDDYSDEHAGLVESDRKRRTREEERARLRASEGNSIAGGRRITNEMSPPPRVVSLKTTDTAGRELPVAERAPLPDSWKS